ncbi:MAG: hypothetical protein R2809_05625 [Flavobacteriales bacterium]
MAWLLSIEMKNLEMMATIRYFTLLIIGLFLGLQSCIVVDNNEMVYGPDGRDGKAFLESTMINMSPIHIGIITLACPTIHFMANFIDLILEFISLNISSIAKNTGMVHMS